MNCARQCVHHARRPSKGVGCDGPRGCASRRTGKPCTAAVSESASDAPLTCLFWRRSRRDQRAERYIRTQVCREMSFAPQALAARAEFSRGCADPACLSTSAPRVTAFPVRGSGQNEDTSLREGRKRRYLTSGGKKTKIPHFGTEEHEDTSLRDVSEENRKRQGYLFGVSK